MERVQELLLERKASIAAGVLDGSLPDHSQYLAQCAEIRALDTVWVSVLGSYEAMTAEGEIEEEPEEGEDS